MTSPEGGPGRRRGWGLDNLRDLKRSTRPAGHVTSRSVVGGARLELAASTMSTWRSGQLS